MSEQLFAVSIPEFLNHTNLFPNLGDTTVLDHDEAKGSVDDLQEDDVVIYYDYCTDYIAETEAIKFRHWHFEEQTTLINNFMTDLGYELINELDGSGDGLYYGILQYRKV